MGPCTSGHAGKDGGLYIGSVTWTSPHQDWPTEWVPDLPTAETRDQYWALIWALRGGLLTLDLFSHGKDSNWLTGKDTVSGYGFAVGTSASLIDCHGIAKGYVLTYPPTSSSLWCLRKVVEMSQIHMLKSVLEKKLFIFSLSHPHFPMLHHSSVCQFWASRGSGGAFLL